MENLRKTDIFVEKPKKTLGKPIDLQKIIEKPKEKPKKTKKTNKKTKKPKEKPIKPIFQTFEPWRPEGISGS